MASDVNWRLWFVGKYVAHRFSRAPRAVIVVMSIPLEGERSTVVAGERLEIPYRLPTLSEQREAAMPEIVEPHWGKSRPLE